MANTLTPSDVYALMNSIVSEATGRTDLTVVDTSTFTSVGEILLRTSLENTIDAISTVVGKTIFSVRPYKGKFDILRTSQERWGAMTRKIVYLYNEAEQSTDWNAAEHQHTLDDGASVDMYKIRKPKALQLNFYGTKILQKHITRFRDQLSLAFHSETEFIQFLDGVMVEFNNEIELILENESRLTLLNYIAGISAMGLTEVDLVAEFNTEYNTTYTRDQLLTTYLESFLKFVVATLKTYSDKLTDMSVNYHANLTDYSPIMRHTPKDKQRLIMYGPFFTNAKASVFSSVHHPEFLEIGDMEMVNYWQSQNDPTEIHVKPNILDVATGGSKTSTVEVELPYVLGVLYDTDALGVTPQFDYATTTPFNSAGGYYNMYHHFRFNSWNDFTENGILFVLGAGGE